MRWTQGKNHYSKHKQRVEHRERFLSNAAKRESGTTTYCYRGDKFYMQANFWQKQNTR